MELLSHFIDIFLHLDVHLKEVINDYGTWTYLILFLIIFLETGLVVTPILPGDSLLFAAGALAATARPEGEGTLLSVGTLLGLLFVAAVLGDALNYTIGKFLGPKVLTENSRIFKRAYLERTERFYEKYGGKTIIFARFVPIVRTFAPFLAGVGMMSYRKFATFNVVGAFLWIFGFVLAGFYFAEIPAVTKNFTLVILAIIVLSVMPAVYEIYKARTEPKPA